MECILVLLFSFEVWGKVMFLHLCVILFTRGVSVLACITGHMVGSFRFSLVSEWRISKLFEFFTNALNWHSYLIFGGYKSFLWGH